MIKQENTELSEAYWKELARLQKEVDRQEALIKMLAKKAGVELHD